MRTHLLTVALLLLSTFAPAGAQSGPPSGAHLYRVDGTFEGEAMFPWMAQLVLDDTIVGGDTALSVSYNSREDGASGWLFSFSTTVARDLSSPSASWRGRGRSGEAWCEAEVAEGLIRIVDAHGAQQSGPHEGPLVPDFALAAAFATLDLEDGATFALTAYRCGADPRGPATIRVWPVEATVTAGRHARASQAEAAVWIVRTTGLELEAVIAATDRTVLSITTQQGGYGESRERYVGTE